MSGDGATAEDAAAPRRGGRPREVDAEAVAAIGLALLSTRGWDAVTMSDIADAAGIGRSSLLRYFPTKLDLVWGADAQRAGRLEALLSSPGEPRAVLEHALSHVLDEEDPDVLRTRVAVLADSSEPASAIAASGLIVDAVVLGFLQRSYGWDPDGLRSRLLTRCLIGAGATALSRWALGSDGAPGAALAEAYHLVLFGFFPERTPTAGG